MRVAQLVLATPLLVSTAQACGGEVPPAAAPPAPSASSATLTGTITAQTPAQHKLAHFRSADGMVGLVLDRSGDKPRYKVDGTTVIIELTPREERETWDRRLQGYYLVSPNGKRPFFIDEGGGITHLRDGDHFELMFDRDAEPLAPANVVGSYTEPPPAYQATVERLKALAVRTRQPQLKAEDAADLTKVSAAMAQATADMFVHYVTHGQTDYPARFELVPQGFTGVSFGGVGYESDAAWDSKAGRGLARYGGVDEGFSHYDTPMGNHMQVLKLRGYAPKLAEGAPGIVWEVGSTEATLVTLDGGRYIVNLTHPDKGTTLEPGAGPQAGWPPAVAETLLTVTDASSLAKAGALPQKKVDDVLALDQEWTKCAAKVWAGSQRAIDTGHFTEADRKDTEKRARATCGPIIRKQEGLLVQLVEARIKERQALLAAAKARVTSVGADH